MWESLAEAWIVIQKYREMIVNVVERQQEVKTKIKGTIELHKEVWIISETPDPNFDEKNHWGGLKEDWISNVVGRSIAFWVLATNRVL